MVYHLSRESLVLAQIESLFLIGCVVLITISRHNLFKDIVDSDKEEEIIIERRNELFIVPRYPAHSMYRPMEGQFYIVNFITVWDGLHPWSLGLQKVVFNEITSNYSAVAHERVFTPHCCLSSWGRGIFLWSFCLHSCWPDHTSIQTARARLHGRQSRSFFLESN